jgi:hypothetical protein
LDAFANRDETTLFHSWIFGHKRDPEKMAYRPKLPASNYELTAMSLAHFRFGHTDIREL